MGAAGSDEGAAGGDEGGNGATNTAGGDEGKEAEKLRLVAVALNKAAAQTGGRQGLQQATVEQEHGRQEELSLFRHVVENEEMLLGTREKREGCQQEGGCHKMMISPPTNGTDEDFVLEK